MSYSFPKLENEAPISSAEILNDFNRMASVPTYEVKGVVLRAGFGNPESENYAPPEPAVHIRVNIPTMKEEGGVVYPSGSSKNFSRLYSRQELQDEIDFKKQQGDPIFENEIKAYERGIEKIDDAVKNKVDLGPAMREGPVDIEPATAEPEKPKIPQFRVSSLGIGQ
ncbi:MAG: hypothetical protein DI551_02385 [Micavibrio aeruginosavorus]|uniref:Uncharacterized protein n=1 Tax=Micavibrio aeruginosavorus TaxID=349221 RepID=A0A2W5PZV9_9BACT|nr:MAG: hypothetical protein DI551_02385 [Micavibrio aeruginosavorus]